MYVFFGSTCLLVIILGLFVINGLVLANREKPVAGTTPHSAKKFTNEENELKIMAYNIAKGFIHTDGFKFSPKHLVSERLEQIAAIIRKEKPDIICLSETVFECTPCPLNQVKYLAEKGGMHSWVFGENYNFGLPFYRIVGGNAILSRFPLQAVKNFSLVGSKPFYITKNNRRVLWAKIKNREYPILIASIHNDSFDRENNLKQVKQILAYKGNSKAIIAGDFNASTEHPSIQLLLNSNEFTADWYGPLTFPSRDANKKIDFILAPFEWELLQHLVIKSNASDHYPVISLFRLPPL